MGHPATKNTQISELEWKVEQIQREVTKYGGKDSVAHFKPAHQKTIRPPFEETSLTDQMLAFEATEREGMIPHFVTILTMLVPNLGAEN